MNTTYPRAASIGWGIFQYARRSLSATAGLLTRSSRCASLIMLMLCSLASTPLVAQTLTANNWRLIYMNAPYSGGGANESQTVYSIHANRQENVLYSFDVSSRYGTTATGPATMTFTTAADPGPGGTNHNNYTLELVALNGHNANVNLDNATTFSRNVTSNLPWVNNSGTSLSGLNYNDSVLDIGSVIATKGPLVGDSATTNPTPNTAFTFTIPQATLQAWFDQTQPATVVITGNSPTRSFYISLSTTQLPVLSIPVTNFAPTDIALSNASIAENNAANATVGTFTATDADAGDTHTFTKVAGTGDTDNASFTIDGAALKLTPSANFEVKNSYSVRVRATDNGSPVGTFEKAFTIAITNVNEAEIGLEQPAGTPRASGATVSYGGVSQSNTGNALAFDGVNDYVSGTTSNLPQGNSARTVEAWVKSSVPFGSQAILGYGSFAPGQMFSIILANGNAYTVGYNVDLNTGYPVADGSWHHYAATHDGTTTRVYIDGVLRGSAAKTYNTAGNAFMIGADWPGGPLGEFFNGQVDEARIWNVARSQAQIQASMGSELVGNESGLVAYWKLNQGVAGDTNTGITTVLATTGSNGTLTNSALSGSTSNWVASTAIPGSSVQTFTISNTGPDALSISSVAVAGGQASDFTVSTAGMLTSIPAMSSTTFTVTFSPRASGLRSTTLTVLNNDADEGTYTLALDGIGGNPPSDITLSPASIAENGAANATVGTFTATDADAGDTHTFTFAAGGADNGAFSISGNTLAINGSADFEAKNSYAIRIRATDASGLFYEEDVTVSITDVTIPQTITFGALAGKTFGDAAFAVSATGGASGEPVTFSIVSGPASIAGSLVTITGAGDVTVRASQAGTGDYAAATPVERSFSVAKAAQTISFTNPGAKTFGDAPFALVASGGGSGETVTFSVVGGPASVNGNLLSITGAGSVTVRASQAGNANYLAAADAEETFNVAQAGQTIAFGPLAGKTFGDAPFAVSATGGASSEPVILSIISGPASIAGSLVTITGAGDVTVRASQAGAGDYAAATPVEQTFTVAPAAQAITFAPLAGKTFGDAPFTVSATGGAGGERVTFSIASGPASIAGSLVTITGAGDVTVRASQAGAGNYAAATPVEQTFTVAKAGQRITFTAPATAGSGDTLTLSAAGGATGNAVTFSVFSGPGSVAGNVLTFTGAGNVVVRASQAGDANYEAAANVDATIDVALNTSPVAVDDAVSITTGDATVYPLANDIEADLDILTITAVSEPSVTIDGRTLIVPAGYTGTFSYTMTDGIGSDTANVTVTSGTAVTAPTTWSGLLFDSAGAIVGRSRITRSVSNVTTLLVQLGATRKTTVVRLAESATTNIAVAVIGNVSVTPSATAAGRFDITLPSGVTGSLRPAVRATLAATYNVALGGTSITVTGSGYFTARVGKTGVASVSGKLPDGTGFSAASDRNDNGTLSFFAKLSSSPTSRVGGELVLADLTKTDLTGELEWAKSIRSGATYIPVLETVLVANGSALSGSTGIPDGDVEIVYSGKTGISPVTFTSTFDENVVATTAGRVANWRTSASKGSFSALFLHPTTYRTFSGAGLYLPKSQTAVGRIAGGELHSSIILRVP